MATIKLYRALARLRYALSGLLATRQTFEELTPAEVALEEDWRAAIEPALVDLYWYPLRNGIAEAPADAAELRAWLERQYEGDRATAALLALLLLYLHRGANVGGSMGLELLGVGGIFQLQDEGYLGAIEAHAEALTAPPGSDLSLLNKTIDDLVRGIPVAREMSNTAQALGAMIASWAVLRGGWIAGTELARMVAGGLNMVYAENDVDRQMFETRGDDRVCPQCGPLDGRTMPVKRIPAELQIPIHVLCRCYYSPILAGWNKPGVIWRG